VWPFNTPTISIRLQCGHSTLPLYPLDCSVAIQRSHYIHFLLTLSGWLQYTWVVLKVLLQLAVIQLILLQTVWLTDCCSWEHILKCILVYLCPEMCMYLTFPSCSYLNDVQLCCGFLSCRLGCVPVCYSKYTDMVPSLQVRKSQCTAMAHAGWHMHVHHWACNWHFVTSAVRCPSWMG
jgi:hypothetical protein